MKNGKNLVKNYEKLRKKNKPFMKDNRGSAIVLVIIAIAMISILASTIMWAAYVNYMIKCSDIRNKNSFYSAETVVEQIMAGVQHEASAAVSRSYQDVMQNWNNDEDEGSRFSRFTTSYLDALIASLKDTEKGSGFYSRQVLEDYVDDELFENVNEDVWDRDGDIYPDLKDAATMQLINNSTLVLHNIRVSYTDENGYVSIVNTDICIDVPKLVFYQEPNIDKLYEYALIGSAGIVKAENGETSVIDGSIYAGNDGRYEPEDDFQGGIFVGKASTLIVQNSGLVISKGDITAKGPNAGFIVRSEVGADNKVYATGLNVESATLSLESKTYVANDLILSGSGSTVTLYKEYYGFGSSVQSGREYDKNDASTASKKVATNESSAILINGKNAKIDMSKITKLMLAGRAYIGQELKPGSPTAGDDGLQPILMGESIAVKGDQIAYLVPAECIGVLKKDGEEKTVIGQNPLDADCLNKMDEYAKTYGDDFLEVDFYKPIHKLGDKKLVDFGLGLEEDKIDKYIRRVPIQYKGSTLVYYYLVMDADNAAEYFVQYYDFNTNKEALDNYFNKYATRGIILGDFEADNTQYTILGNSVVSGALEGSSTLYTGVEQSLEVKEGYQENSENAEKVGNDWGDDEVTSMATEISNKYKALCTNLTENASAGGNLNVFNSIIDENALRDYLTDPTKAPGGTVVFETNDGYKAVFTIGTNGVYKYKDDNKVRLIVAIDGDYNPNVPNSPIDGGNVLIESNFTGIIIAQGKVTIGKNVLINRDKTNVYRVLNAPLKNPPEDENDRTAMMFFVNGNVGGTLRNEVTGVAKVDETGTLDLNLSQIVRYSNWIKK